MDVCRRAGIRSGRSRALALVAGLALLGSCTVESSPSMPTAVPLALRTVLPASASVPVLSLVDRARVVATHANGDVAGETTVAVQPNQSTLSIDLEVTLTEPVERLTVVVELLVGEVVALSGTASFDVDSSQPVTQAPVVNLNPVAPALEVDPLTLQYSVITGATPYEFPFRVTNSGGGVLAWVATTDVPGLTIAPPGGSLTQGQSSSVLAVQDPGQMQPGTYGGTITVDAPLALGSPQDVAVTVEVTEPPVIELSASLLEFVAAESVNPTPQEVTLSNIGVGPLNWTASPAVPWIAVEPASGVLGAQESVTLTVIPTTESLTVGNYSTSFAIQDPNASNSPQVVDVQVFVDEGPLIGLSRTSVTFNAWLSENPPSQQVTVTNDGGSILSWRAFHTSPWLTVSPASGSLARAESATLNISASVAGLAVGSYTGTVTVQDANASNSPRTITVGLTISERPRISLSTTSMEFASECSAPPQSLVITNSGGSPLQWRATSNASWLSASPSSGTVNAGQSQTISVMAPSANTYESHGTLTISDPDASNSPRTVAVTLFSYCVGGPPAP